MFAFIDYDTFVPPQASVFAEQYDLLFFYTSFVCLIGAALVYGLLLYCCIRFARREGVQSIRILGSTKLELMWTVIPMMFFLSMFVWGVRLYDEAITIPEEAQASEREYFAVGKQWMWKIQHPTGQREINELHLAQNVAIKLTGTSEDVIHDFGVPAFRSKFDVIPGRYTSVWYKPTKVGHYYLFCDQYCGQGHSQMVGMVHVLSQEDHQAWLEGTYRREGKNPVDGSPSWEGRKLFLKLQCVNCHNRESDARAPSLEGIFGANRTVFDRDSGKTIVVKANNDYLRTAIREPDKHVREGWKPIMPAFTRNQATEEELLNLVAYIKSLKPGDLPSRNESSPAPVGAPIKDTKAGTGGDK